MEEEALKSGDWPLDHLLPAGAGRAHRTTVDFVAADHLVGDQDVRDPPRDEKAEVGTVSHRLSRQEASSTWTELFINDSNRW